MTSFKFAGVALTLLLASCGSERTEVADGPSSNSEIQFATPSIERQISNPFPNASELRLFVEVGYDNDGRPIFSDEGGVKLSEDQRRDFENALKIEGAPEEMAACFIPHHFFKYYSSSGEQIGEVEICFCCEGVASSGSDALTPQNGEILSAAYSKVRAVVAAAGQPTDVLCDQVMR